MRIKKTVLIITIVVILLGIIIGMYLLYSKHRKQLYHHAAVNPTVVISKVQSIQWTKKMPVIGTVVAARGANISASVPGIVSKVNFSSGQKVKKGAMLIKLESGDIAATVNEDRVKHDLSRRQYQRYRKLFSTNAIAQFDLDKYTAEMKQAKAQLDHDVASLRKTIITAPFSGTLGIRKVNQGQYISPGQPIVSLQDLSTLHVDFYVPERHVSVIKVGGKIEIIRDKANKKPLVGHILAIGVKLDKNTRSLLVRAIINQPCEGLLPGMYIKVMVPQFAAENILIIPQTAITYNPYGDYVYVYNNGKVFQRIAHTGDNVKNFIIIKRGLKKGDAVVIEGQQKLYSGMDVNIKQRNQL